MGQESITLIQADLRGSASIFVSSSLKIMPGFPLYFEIVPSAVEEFSIPKLFLEARSGLCANNSLDGACITSAKLRDFKGLWVLGFNRGEFREGVGGMGFGLEELMLCRWMK